MMSVQLGDDKVLHLMSKSIEVFFLISEVYRKIFFCASSLSAPKVVNNKESGNMEWIASLRPLTTMSKLCMWTQSRSSSRKLISEASSVAVDAPPNIYTHTVKSLFLEHLFVEMLYSSKLFSSHVWCIKAAEALLLYARTIYWSKHFGWSHGLRRIEIPLYN